MLRPDPRRKKEFKKGIDAEEARRKREDNIIELRKNKRDENLQKKRQTFATPQYAVEDSTKSGGHRVGWPVFLLLCTLFFTTLLGSGFSSRWGLLTAAAAG